MFARFQQYTNAIMIDDRIAFPIVRQIAFTSGFGGGKFTVRGPDSDAQKIFIIKKKAPTKNRLCEENPKACL